MRYNFKKLDKKQVFNLFYEWVKEDPNMWFKRDPKRCVVSEFFNFLCNCTKPHYLYLTEKTFIIYNYDGYFKKEQGDICYLPDTDEFNLVVNFSIPYDDEVPIYSGHEILSYLNNIKNGGAA